MSTDQSTPAGGYPDIGGASPPLDGAEPGEVSVVAPLPPVPAAHPDDQGIDLRTAASLATRTVLLPVESGPDVAPQGADMAVALFRFNGQREAVRPADVALPIPGESPEDLAHVGLAIYPTLVPDAHAVAVMRRRRQGHVTNREDLAWVRQSWMHVYRMRTDFTSTEGPRREVRFACDHQLFDSLSGRPFTAKAPGNIQPLLTAGPDVAPIRPRVPPDDIIDETVRLWNHYCGLELRPAQRRHARALSGRGVPAAIARTIDVQLEAQLLVPIFVGLLSHSSGDRLVVVDGLGGGLQHELATAVTADYRYLMGELDRSRFVHVGSN